MSARPPVPLTLSVTIQVESTTRFDLVTYYANLSEEGRTKYAQMNPDRFTNRGDHQWPIEFLVPGEQGDFASGIGLDLHGSDAGVDHDHHPTEDIEAHISRDPAVAGRRDWTVEDFDLLRANVPWLDAFHRRREGSSHECGGCGQPIRDVAGSWQHTTGGWVSDHPVAPRAATPEDRIRVNAGVRA